MRNFAHIVSHNLRSHASNFKMLLNLLVHDDPEFKENEFIQYLETASDDLKETFEVIISCKDETQQEQVYNKMIADGFNVRVLTL